MQIYGKEIKFLLTSGARRDIDKLPKEIKGYDLIFQIAIIMSNYHERRKKFEDPDYQPVSITAEELETLDDTEIKTLRDELDQATAEGNARLVEAEESKKKEDTGSK